ncbi:MAG TPA: hypothetical protein ENH19_01770 [Actinobacteria bacterium]|nr:hypothetical protein [Actinomycetes bacterium]HEX21365.1 hypothetical protein [Actinomycetota bacterium]
MKFFNRLSSRDQILALIGFFALFVALVFMLLIRPQFQHLQSLAAEREAQTSKLEQAKLNLQRLKSIKSESAQIEANLIKITRRLPVDAEVPSMLVELQDLADVSGLDFKSAKINDVVDKSGFSEIPFDIKASGTFYSLVDYLYRLENMARKVSIIGVTITSSEKEYPTIEVGIKAKTFKLNSTGQTALPKPPETQGQSAPAGQNKSSAEVK